MGRKKATIEELSARSHAKAYTPGAHHAHDSIKDKKISVAKTLEVKTRRWNNSKSKSVTLIEQKQQAGQYHGVMPKRLEKGVPPLDIASLKDFLRFKVSVSKGVIDNKGRLTLDSMKTFEEWFFAGFARVTGNSYAEEDRHELYEWTRNTLVRETLVVNKKKPKYLFEEHEWIQSYKTFWTNDDIRFIHSRNKVQISFAIAVYC